MIESVVGVFGRPWRSSLESCGVENFSRSLAVHALHVPGAIEIFLGLVWRVPYAQQDSPGALMLELTVCFDELGAFLCYFQRRSTSAFFYYLPHFTQAARAVLR